MGSPNIENRVFRMHTKFAVVTTLSCAVLVAILTTLGEVIICDTAECDLDPDECEALAWANSYPVTDGTPSFTRWYYVTLLIQATIGLIPWLVWTVIENRQVFTITDILKKERVEAGVKLFLTRCPRTIYGFTFVFLEYCNWAISLGQIFWMLQIEPFPTTIIPTITLYGPGGNPVQDSFFCILPHNQVNEGINSGLTLFMGFLVQLVL